MLSTKSLFPCHKSLLSLREIFWALLGKILALFSWLFGVGLVSRQMEVACNRMLDHLSMSKEGECSEGPTLPLGNTNLLLLIWLWLLPCALISDFWPRGTLYPWRLQHCQFSPVWSLKWKTSMWKTSMQVQVGNTGGTCFSDVSQAAEQQSV